MSIASQESSENQPVTNSGHDTKSGNRRVAIFSDIHSNLEAFQAVLADIKKEKVEHLICLGDVVGYNANPSECLALVRSLGCALVKGNHDDDATSNSSLSDYRDMARLSMAYTRARLSNDEKEFLKQLPFVQYLHGVTVVHASLYKPEEFYYVDSRIEAIYHFTSQMTQLAFCGHTHIPQIYVKSGAAVTVERTGPLKLKDDLMYLVNVGSVGQPRDRNWHSSYVIYNPETKEVEFRRVEYDLATAQRKIREANLPAALADRLAVGM